MEYRYLIGISTPITPTTPNINAVFVICEGYRFMFQGVPHSHLAYPQYHLNSLDYFRWNVLVIMNGNNYRDDHIFKLYQNVSYCFCNMYFDWTFVVACYFSMFVVVNFNTLAQASDFRIERRQIVFICWMQDWTQGLRRQIASRLNAHWQKDWAIEDQAKNLNSTARPYDQRAFSPSINDHHHYHHHQQQQQQQQQ